MSISTSKNKNCSLPVEVHELYADLLECSLSQQLSLDPGKSLMRVVVSLFDQAKLLSLTLVQAALHTVGLLQSLQGQDEQLGVMLVGERWKGNRRKSTRGGRENQIYECILA